MSDGSVFYTTQKLTVSDLNLDQVLLDGEALAFSGTSCTFTVPGNTDAGHVLTVSDNAGNSIEIRFSVKTLQSLADTIGDLEVSSVNSGDTDRLNAYLKAVSDLGGLPNNTEEENDELDGMYWSALKMLQVVREAADAAGSETLKQVKNVTPDNVVPEDIDLLLQASDELDRIFAAFGGNYTEEEKKALTDLSAQVEAALNSLRKADALLQLQKELPLSAEPDDDETEQKVTEAQKAYDALTEHEKELVGGDLPALLSKLRDDLKNYQLLSGDGAVWKGGTKDPLTFVASGSVRKFTAFSVDGKLLSEKQYTLTSGSTVITLEPSYLKTLKAGKHTFRIQYCNGEVTGSFFTEEAKVPSTGDTSAQPLWIFSSLLALSAAAAVMAVHERDKKRKKNG